ncbi:MAG: ABC transporter ATP-binding protein [Dysgonamonadaceae bacterium]|jgi:iron complex transport system ATP-binding protein|nr:ABC transporter ATP-binding protein [Dysgonamonadaceae bacterium]
MDRQKNPEIEIKDLSIGYNKAKKKHAFPLYHHLSAAIYKQQLTCLLGVNGSGKSTLLKTLAAFQPALAGEILVQNRPLASYSNQELAQTIGVVLTERIAVSDLSVAEVVAMGRSPYTGFWGRLTKTDKQIVAEALEQTGIESLAGRSFQNLSDGERQKCMIAKVLAQQTPIILLDEPTAFLDFPSKVEIMQLLYHLTHQAGRTIFLSTHDLELAIQMADTLWLMDPKKGIATGSPQTLMNDGSLENLFLSKGIRFDRATGFFHISKPE